MKRVTGKLVNATILLDCRGITLMSFVLQDDRAILQMLRRVNSNQPVRLRTLRRLDCDFNLWAACWLSLFAR